jgi:hypothetical protein
MQAFAQQTTTTVTTSKGAFSEYVPGSETMVVKTESGPAPLRYSVTKQTTVVDESGAPVAIDHISAGSPVSIQYSGTGDRLVASRIVVQKTAPVAVTDQQTTTTSTRPVTRHEEHELKEAEKHKKKAAKEEEKAQKHAEEANGGD